MPIPCRSFKSEVVFRFEMALGASEQHNTENDSPDANMETVKTRQHKESRAVDTRTQGQAHFCVRFMIFECLKCYEQKVKATVAIKPLINWSRFFANKP